MTKFNLAKKSMVDNQDTVEPRQDSQGESPLQAREEKRSGEARIASGKCLF